MWRGITAEQGSPNQGIRHLDGGLLFAMATGSGAVDVDLGTWVAEDLICFVVQSCPSLRNPRDCSPPVSSVYADSPDKNTGVGCHALLQGIFPTQGLNLGLLHANRFFTI